MKTAREREEDFLRELRELLEKHGAELFVTDDKKGFGQHSGVCEVSMESVFEAGDLVAEFAYFELPNYMP